MEEKLVHERTNSFDYIIKVDLNGIELERVVRFGFSSRGPGEYDVAINEATFHLTVL